MEKLEALKKAYLDALRSYEVARWLGTWNDQLRTAAKKEETGKALQVAYEAYLANKQS